MDQSHPIGARFFRDACFFFLPRLPLLGGTAGWGRSVSKTIL